MRGLQDVPEGSCVVDGSDGRHGFASSHDAQGTSNISLIDARMKIDQDLGVIKSADTNRTEFLELLGEEFALAGGGDGFRGKLEFNLSTHG